MKTQTIYLNQEKNVTLTAYLQEVGGEFEFTQRPAVLILPGGAYAMCSDREADPVANAYLRAGYQAFILRYTVGKGTIWPEPLNDYEQAMEQIRKNCDQWHVDADKIAVVGFSAGGHLAACAATMAKNKPAAAVLVYPAVLKEITQILPVKGIPAPVEAVDKKTVPCFLVAARDDSVVSIRNTLLWELALTEHNIPFESHIYSYGGHGFSTAEEWICTASVSSRLSGWVSDSIGWLGENMGTLTRKGFTTPNIAVQGNGNDAPVLSVACTLSHIRKQGENVKAILQPLFDGIAAVAKQRGFSEEGLMAAVGNTTVRELMETVGLPEETIVAADTTLHGIVNQQN